MKLTNNEDYIEFLIDRYYAEVESEADNSYNLIVNAKSAFMNVKFYTYCFVQSFKRFYDKLLSAYKNLNGVVILDDLSYENDVNLKIIFENYGKISVECHIKSNDRYKNECNLYFETDQTFIKEFLEEIKIEFEF